MPYNFDEIIPRQNTNSVKWDLAGDKEMLPLWVADMDFKTCPAVLKSFEELLAHGIFGYTLTPTEYFEAIASWWQKRHQFKIEKEWIIPVTGIIPGFSAILRSLGIPGDKVILQDPVYNHFYTTIENCGFGVVENHLIYTDNKYSIDFEDFEQKTKDPKVKLFVLCNPHNPIGRVWRNEELVTLGKICLKNGVTVISDEIHSDLVFNNHKHIPFASISKEFSEITVTCSSPSKTFNLAGIQAAYLFTSNEEYRQKIDLTLAHVQESNMLNPFAVKALIAAYNDGETWLEELNNYLYENYLFLLEYCKKNIPKINILPLEATYLVWLDCGTVISDSKLFCKNLRENEKLWLMDGISYGTNGEGFLRINIGCPRSILEEALVRLGNVLK